MLVSHTRSRVEEQLQDSDEIAGKALGVAAVDVAALALVVAVRDDLCSWWRPPALGFGVAAVLFLLAVWPPRQFDAGPDPTRFYERFGGGTRLDASRAMLSELTNAMDNNAPLLATKNRLFKAGFWVLIASVAGALIVALVS